MNPTTAVRLQGYRIAFPGYLPVEPGQRDPLRRPPEAARLLPGLQLGEGPARPALRRLLHAHERRPDVRRVRELGPVAQHHVGRAALARQLRAGPDPPVPGRHQPATASRAAPTRRRWASRASPSNNKYDEFALYANDTWSVTDRLKINLGLRYEYFGPQKKSEPKYDSNFYYSDDGCSVNTSSLTQILDCIRGGTVLTSNESPSGNLWANDWNNFAPRVGFAWDVTGDGKTSLRGGYGIGYERNFGNVTYNVLFNPPEYLVASIDAPTDTPTLPIYTDNQGPFGGVAGVTKPIPAGSLRHVDQNIETAYTHFYSLSLQREIAANTVASVEYTGSTGRKLYDLADPNKRGRGARVPGHRDRHASARSPSTPPSTPAATAASRSTTG